MTEPHNFDDDGDRDVPQNRYLFDRNEQSEFCGDQQRSEESTKKDTICIRRNLTTTTSLPIVPRMNPASTNGIDEDRKVLAQRLSALTVSMEKDEHRSTTPVPPPRTSPITELSPATLNRLRSCGANNSTTGSTTSSPCVTEVTQVVTNTTTRAVSSSLKLPYFGNGGSNRDSPSTSQVSVGSIPPTLTAALLPAMRHHYDLTPVTRNTSSSTDANQNNQFAVVDRTESNRLNTVTPSDDVDYENDDGPFLHGEHLAMPSDFMSSSNEDPLTGPSLLQPSLMRVIHHPRNINDDEDIRLTVDNPYDGLELPVNLADAVEFPPRKFYTFTSRRQYEEERRSSQHAGDCPNASSTHTIKQYQPNRQENFDIETMPEEELRRIFIARRSATRVGNTEFQQPTGPVSGDDADKNHRLLYANIPFDDEARQWSIPSLRMAQNLHGSTTSLTDATEIEDEDSLVYIYNNNTPATAVSTATLFPDSLRGFRARGIVEANDGNDDLSISSRGSSLFLPEEFSDDSHFRRCDNMLHLPHPFATPSDVVYSDDTDSVEAVAIGGEDEITNELRYESEKSRRRKRKQQRQKEAYEWLQSVEVDQNVVAEAASSKFLTAGNLPDEIHYPQQYLHHQLLLRPLEKLEIGSQNHQTRRQSSPSVFLERQTSSPPNLKFK
jgi:hypothetical protein